MCTIRSMVGIRKQRRVQCDGLEKLNVEREYYDEKLG